MPDLCSLYAVTALTLNNPASWIGIGEPQKCEEAYVYAVMLNEWNIMKKMNAVVVVLPAHPAQDPPR